MPKGILPVPCNLTPSHFKLNKQTKTFRVNWKVAHITVITLLLPSTVLIVLKQVYIISMYIIRKKNAEKKENQ